MGGLLLISVDDVKQRMAINPELKAVDSAIESAIYAAQLRMESEYGSSFQYKQNTDYFFLDSESFNGVSIGSVFRLMLRNAFISLTDPFEVKCGENWNSCTTPVPSSLYSLDTERGILRVDFDTYKDMYIRVDYYSGFQSQADVPDWLAEAILSYTPVVFNIGQTTNRNQEAEPIYKSAGDHALAIMARHSRNIGFCIGPL